MVSSFLRAISHGLKKEKKVDSHWKHFFVGLAIVIPFIGLAHHEMSFIATYSQKYRNGG